MALVDELVRLQGRMTSLKSSFLTQRSHLQGLTHHRQNVSDADMVQALVNVNNVLSDLCEVVNDLISGMQRQADASLNQWLSRTAGRG